MLLASALFCFSPALVGHDPDRDGDGLSDFHEVHKHFTDPTKADSDGDGVPDGDWSERREYTYTVRTLIDVVPPVTDDVLCDDYQDARVLERDGEHVQLEVIHYPLNTVAESLAPDPKWREHAQALREWTEPGPTANWDAELQAELVAALKKDGIDPDVLDDVELVRRASKWLLERARYVDGFTTFCSTFEGGRARVLPGMEESAERGRVASGLTLDEQWERELFAKGMFRTKTRGSCTSSAIYLNGCLKALGIPTRTVLCVPAIDGSDAHELELAERRLSHPAVRATLLAAARQVGNSWTSHTFNEVFVGGRWRRLNYDRLGQNILDPQFLGLMTHVATFRDWADGEMAKTWGLRQASEHQDADVFGHANPYSALAISDAFGPHAERERLAALDPSPFKVLTIEKLYWYFSPERKVEMRLDDPETAGHLLVHVREGGPELRTDAYATFYGACDKEFVLRADGRPDVRVRATRGYWIDPKVAMREFYLRIEPDELVQLAHGVRYSLVARNQGDGYRWKVADGVGIVRDATSTTPAPATAAASTDDGTSTTRGEPVAAERMTIDRVVWSDDPELERELGPLDLGEKPVLLGHVAEWDGFEKLKRFTESVDSKFFMETEGQPYLGVHARTGGITSSDGRVRYVVIELGPADWRDLVPGARYTLRPRNSVVEHRWRVADDVAVARTK